MIPNETVDRVREAADAVEIIGEHVKLRRVGTSFRGPCPFHGGKNPNFSVNPRTNTYHCFKCGESGDVFSFVQKRIGLDFVEAVKYVGARAGVEVREVESRREVADPREPLWEMHAAAAEFYQRTLWEDAAAAPAREYLTSRRLSREVADRFGLGFAPWEAERLREHLAALGYTEAQQLEAGLLVRREDAEGAGAIRPRFRGRLMFPIHDAQGRAIAFGGRVIGKGEPKYLNSPESPIFVKGRTLYNLHRARGAARRDERAIVVEGYFDAIRLAAAGVEAVVAPLGTAMTAEQALVLARITRTVFLLYDSDQAGLKATFRAGDELLRNGVAVQVVTLPNGDDPDTFVAAHGGEGLERHLATALDVFERKIQILQRGGWFADLRRKRAALDRLIPTIRAAADPLTRDLYLGRASEVAGVGRALLAREVTEAVTPSASNRPRHSGEFPGRDADAPPPQWEGEPDRAAGRRPGRPGAERRRSAATADEVSERALLRALLQHRNFLEGVAERVSADAIRTAPLRDIYVALVAAGPDATMDELAGALDAPLVATVDALMTDAIPEEIAAGDIESTLAWIGSRALRERLAAIDREMRSELTREQEQRLLAEKKQLKLELNAMGKPLYRTFSTDSSLDV